jgi:hypothetical protein
MLQHFCPWPPWSGPHHKNSNKIIYGTKIRNTRQIQMFLARKKSGIANKNQKRITAGTH